MDNVLTNSDSFSEEMKTFPAHVLLAMATNESATKYYRKAAVRLLLEHKSILADHPSLRELRMELREEDAAKQEVEAIVDNAMHEPEVTCPEPDKGPFQASVTTKSLFQNEE